MGHASLNLLAPSSRVAVKGHQPIGRAAISRYVAEAPGGSEVDVRHASGATAGDVCRLVVVAPDGRKAEVAVPAGVAICDLMPALLKHAGPGLADAGLEHGGWVLQRIGEAPLDEDRAPAALGLRDGDMLALRPRDEALPEMDFDDLVDGISVGIRARPDRWREEMTRRLLLGFMLAALTGGWLALLPAGSVGLRAAAAGVVAGLLIAATAVVARVTKDPGAATALGLAAIPYAALCGALAEATGPAVSLHLSAYQLFGTGAAVVSAAFLCLLLNASARPLFVGVAVVGAAGALIAVPALTGALHAEQAAAVLLSLALLLGPRVPVASFRLARLRTTSLPTGADDLGEDIEPVPAGPLLDQVALTDRYMTALFCALGTICAVCLTRLAAAPGWAAAALCLAVCAVLLLRSRMLLSAWQRMAAVVPAVFGLLLLVGESARSFPLEQRLAAQLGGLVVVAALLLVAARILPGRRLLPYWGRAADLSETLVALSVAPLLFQVLGLYGYLRNLVG
ncbi:type VII secretion integral membrane protein EccD [Kitasatospora indigofera]|uniref:type VII secretion integral membrane protein EccD n=1 Tax=Kitasatospora indigofera TaxID=67307 RepID=UPI0036CF3D01